MNSPLVWLTADIILGVSWVVAWQQILFADELPGDGFTAGVLFLVAILLQYVVRGQKKAATLLPVSLFYKGAVVGVLVLTALFAMPLLWGGQPLQHFSIPLGVGKLSSTTLFDLAIFLMIAGVLVDALTSLPEPGE